MKSWVCKWRHFWKTAVQELRHLLCWKLCKCFFLRSVHLYATLRGPESWWLCCPRTTAGQMVTAHPWNLSGACADTRGHGVEPYPTQVLWNSRPVCLHLASPFACAQIQGCSPAGSSSCSLGAAVPTDWPTGRELVVGVFICAGTASRGLTHVPALSASRGSVATPDRRGPLYIAPCSRPEGCKGTSMGSGVVKEAAWLA